MEVVEAGVNGQEKRLDADIVTVLSVVYVDEVKVSEPVTMLNLSLPVALILTDIVVGLLVIK